MLEVYTIIIIAIAAAFIAVLIAILVFMGYLRKILSIASFMSPNATIFAIGAKYTESSNISRLLDMSTVSEVIADAKKEGYHIDNLDMADIQIEKDMLDMMDEVITMLPEGARQFSEVYMLKYDTAIVKRILRGKHANISNQEIYRSVYEGRFLTKLIINHMVEATNVEDAISALDSTPFKGAIAVWAERNNLYDVDTYLDRFVMEQLTEAKDTLDEDSREAIEKFLSILLDVYNLKVLIRGKAMSIENLENFIISDGYELTEWKLKLMAESRNLDELMSHLEGTDYAFIREMKLPFRIELALDQYLLNKVNELALVYSVSSGPAVMFLVAKEYEARNLKVVVKGFMENIPKDMIRGLLVGDAI